MEKINLVEILKDCPRGMELDCTSYDNVSFDKISDDKKATYPIFCYITDKEGNRSGMSFTENGCESKRYGAKCVIFPKGKTTWEGFHIPFRNGDIVAFDNPHRDNLQVFIFKNKEENSTLSSCYLMLDGDVLDLEEGMYYVTRLATEEEKEKLFKAIKDNGYKWNEESKSLEKLPKFKVGDRIILKNNQYNIPSIRINAVIDGQYILENGGFLYIDSTDEKYVLENKFDINTLKPFDKVLIRLTNNCVWMPKLFSHYDTGPNVKYYPFVTTDNIGYPQCIPYNGNEHLCRKTYDCDDFYKTWE